MRKTSDKLVRDKIPQIIGAAGGTSGTVIMAEEAQEAADARPDDPDSEGDKRIRDRCGAEFTAPATGRRAYRRR